MIEKMIREAAPKRAPRTKIERQLLETKHVEARRELLERRDREALEHIERIRAENAAEIAATEGREG
jgi:hypothetical protein